MANNQNQSGGQSSKSDSGQGDVQNPETDGRLKENGGGQQGQGDVQSGDDGRLKENGGGQQNRGGQQGG